MIEEDRPLEDAEQTCSLELSNTFTPGGYYFVVCVNDELLTAHPFTMAE